MMYKITEHPKVKDDNEYDYTSECYIDDVFLQKGHKFTGKSKSGVIVKKHAVCKNKSETPGEDAQLD